MSEVPRNVGIVSLNRRERVANVVSDLGRAAVEMGFNVFDASDAATPREDLDLIVGVGGDGTLMRAAHIAHELGVPVIGINLGTVGYLTEVDPGNVDQLLSRLAAGDLVKQARMTVAAELPDGSVMHGINDVVLEKVISQRLVKISVDINDAFFTTFRADGLIVATPLGSTAYSLSAGGPIVAPDLDVLIMTPVAPHSLMNRPTVFAPDTSIRFTVATERQVRVNVDGHVGGVLEEGESVVVRAGHRHVDFLTMGFNPFPQAVRHQFGLDHA